MHVLIATIGSHGDLHPFLAVGRTLVARGHRVTVTTHPYFTPDIEAAGLTPSPIPTDASYERLLREPDLFHRFRGPLVLVREFGAALTPLIAHLRRTIAAQPPDAMLVHLAALGAGWVAEEAGVPHAIAALSPLFWNDPDDPVPMLQLAPGAWRRRQARVAGRAAVALLRAASDAWANRLRARTGFPPGRDLLLGAARGGDLNLALWSGAFRPALAGDPPQGAICGFPWYDGGRDAPLDPGLERFLAAGEAPVVFTLGSAAVHSARDFFGLAARACARLGRRGVLLVGRGLPAPADLPRGVIAVPWAPHSRLFPRALANVHHGGIGSTAQALRAGRPALVIPHAYDQFNNALRVTTLGAGRMLARHRTTEARLAREIERCLGDAAIAASAAELGGRLAAEDGAAAAAGHLERLAAAGRREAA
ncbi:MAG TPA: glycosyltransferase [Candidatus Eisenbacteria bacterium]|jgi:MGT family glycosyltransferase